MDFIRQQIAVIQERLRGLSPSQKMLAGTLVVIMAMTMLYWGKFASDREMVALYGPLDGEALQAATAQLTANGITFDTSTGLLRVPADRQLDAIKAVAAAATAPGAEGSSALESTLDKLSPLATQGEFNARLGAARNATLKQMIRSFSGVVNAQVQVTDSLRGSLTPTPAGVVVNITTNRSVNPRKLANAALALVLPAVSNLKREGVTITVDGSPIISPASNTGLGSNEWLEARTSYEEAYAQELKKNYEIPGLQITVTAELDGQTKHERSSSVDPLNKISLPTKTISEKTSTSEGSLASEPGAVPNTGLDATASAATPQSVSKTEKVEEALQNEFGRKELDISTPAGAAKILSAMVRVPREYYVKCWKLTNKGAEPTSEQLESYVTTQLGRMKEELKTKMLIADDKIVVNDYVGYEDPAMLVAAETVTAGTGGTLTLLAGSHGKEVAIGALALTSLFMVGRMVKKSAPQPVAPLMALDDMPDITSKSRKPTTLGGFDLAGEVAEGGSVMMGQELDDEVLQTSQMVEQVTGFVKENPDATAQLLKRWMSRE